jgi:hypothetical protein
VIQIIWEGLHKIEDDPIYNEDRKAKDKLPAKLRNVEVQIKDQYQD